MNMDNFEEYEDNYIRVVNNLDEKIDKITKKFSLKIRNKKDKNERVTFLKYIKKVPSNPELKKINEIVIGNEDYETCDAIQEFCYYKRIVL
jgi:hypothetical protein